LTQVVLVGDSKAGKSCLLSAFAGGSFEPLYSPTVGVDFKARTVQIDDGDGNGGTIKMTLWDSAGEGQNYQAIQSTYYKGARCAVVAG
jgi:small GTP-binding protein